MIVCRDIADCRTAIAALRRDGCSIGFVPTMGFLHDGHMSLIARAQADCDAVAVSIFVNPSQFGQAADLASYPRDEARDLALLEGAGVDVVFMPETDTVYPPGDETIVETTRMANTLHGAVRPGHFRGVSTVVTRLFNIVQPDLAVFGEKDFQQLQVIRRMVRDLHVPVRIVGAPTVREADGLALSSRNVRLTPEDRAAAPVLHRALEAGQTRMQQECATVAALRSAIETTIAQEPRAALAGLDLVHPDTLEALEGPVTGPVAVMVAAQFGEVLLIDQKVMTP
ncbi:MULTISPECIES: pantoate--beta-alanine ligase [Sediminimonas]|uniref:pantoate--beta-alanine ligase n=1 Tax=Sediminimonas TaxID=659427 RepID=UPI00040A2E89|nr:MULTISPECIES: pantoate--beta-alanine ligase [Sediminimonas]MDR9485102.1 pantoate--beta-alanine ligase [Sediminimonas sp.]